MNEDFLYEISSWEEREELKLVDRRLHNSEGESSFSLFNFSLPDMSEIVALGMTWGSSWWTGGAGERGLEPRHRRLTRTFTFIKKRLVKEV